MVSNLKQFKMENMQRKNLALKNDWTSVKARNKVVCNNFRSIIEICQEFKRLDDKSQETELIDYILMLSARHLDESNATINCDFSEEIFRVSYD